MTALNINEDFNRSKIYEKMDYAPEPAGYSSNIPWVVQQQIAATNGIHYVDRIGKLKDFPIFELPVPAVTGEKLMLDIGNGWGRWLVAGANKGYIPVGLDIRLEFCQTALKCLQLQGKKGYSVVGDLENLPFKDNIFDLVWSFSVIQHTHFQRLNNCLAHVNRILHQDGFSYLEFPNKNGIHNRLGPVKASEHEKDDLNSWCVRYYTPEAYKAVLEKYLEGATYHVHSFLGIGVLKEDLKYVSPKNKMLEWADSLYFHCTKKEKCGADRASLAAFLQAHHARQDNLNIVHLLRCPKYGGHLTLSADRKKLLALEAGIFFPVENGVPILVKSEALPL
jgi:ubiquinone/menaquinone biosynthesis C-methylase UbiE/uncharacterized protein YbaR (Trm112 family)